MSPAQYLEQADRVYLARAEKETIKGKERHLTFSVLLTIKGKAARTWTLSRDVGELSPCPVAFKVGDAALLFIDKGTVSLCSGNFPINAHLVKMDRYLRLVPAGKKKRSPPLAALKAALSRGLKGYLHDRTRVPVHHIGLKGRKMKLGKTAMPVVGPPGKKGTAGVIINKAMTRGPVHFISGFYSTEGVSFQVLLHEQQMTGKFRVLGWAGAER